MVGTYPLLKQSTEILLQRVPRQIEQDLLHGYQKLYQIPGVLGYSKQHFWELMQNEYCGTIVIHCHHDYDGQSVLYQVQGIFKSCGISNMNVQIVKDSISSY